MPPPRLIENWRNVSADERERNCLKTSKEDDESPHWIKRWTAVQLERNPDALAQFERMIDLEQRNPRSNVINWSRGSPHRGLSKFLSSNLRGLYGDTTQFAQGADTGVEDDMGGCLNPTCTGIMPEGGRASR